MRNRGVTFHPDPRLLLLPLLLQLHRCPPGGFSSPSALGGVAHRRLGESNQPAAAADAQKGPPGPRVELLKAVWSGPISPSRHYTAKRSTLAAINRRDLSGCIRVYLYFSERILITLFLCLNVCSLLTFSAELRLLFYWFSMTKRESTKRI